MRKKSDDLSLLEENYHGVSYIQTNVAAIVVCYRVTALLNDEAVPVTLILAIKFIFDLPRDV